MVNIDYTFSAPFLESFMRYSPEKKRKTELRTCRSNIYNVKVYTDGYELYFALS